MHLRTYAVEDIKNKNIILRVDYNVPMENGEISDSFRIDATLDAINLLLSYCNKLTLISHLGKPKERDEKFSLKPIARYLEKKLNLKIGFLDNIDAVSDAKLSILENLRFYDGEEKNDPEFAKKISLLGNVYINDAFSCSHRAHASIEAINHFCQSFAGPLLCKEVTAIEEYMNNIQKPVAAIIGGSKISTKIGLIKSLLPKIDILFIGGAMANSFLYYQNIDIGKSIYENNVRKEIEIIKQIATKNNVEIVLPIDFIVSNNINNPSYILLDAGNKIGDKLIFDIGKQTVKLFVNKLKAMKTVFWNGPLGAFEHVPFNKGTEEVAEIIANYTAENNLISVIGGGDTIHAITKSALQDKFTYVSTGGGALLSYLENKSLPGIVNLLD